MVKEGYKFGVPPLVLGGILFAIRWSWAGGVLIFLGLFVFYFFRDPERVIPAGEDNIVSPADGRVVEISDEAFDAAAGQRVSIFLAVWNVHIQRAPVAGRIADVVYRPGKF